MTVEINLAPELEGSLLTLSKETGKPVSELTERAIKDMLEDREDYMLAHESATANEPTYSLEEVRRELGLED